MQKTILLLLGPSGVGKSSLIAEILRFDQRFAPISAFTTRPVRHRDLHRITVSEAAFDRIEQQGGLLALNRIYGYRYGTPKRFLSETIRQGKVPLLDCPVHLVSGFERDFPNQTFRVYVGPPTIEILRKRLEDGRDPDGSRLACGLEELALVRSGRYESSIDLHVINTDDAVEAVAQDICARFWNSSKEDWPEANAIKLKNDRYRNARGGSAVLLVIVCARCGCRVMLYQKDGHGGLHRLYLNRIMAPQSHAILQADERIRTPKDLVNLACARCGNIIGTPMLHHEGRLAYRLRAGAFLKRTYEGSCLHRASR